MALIEIYGTSTCNWCDRAQEACAQYGLDYTYKSLDDRFSGEEYMKELKEKVPDAKTVPQVFWAGKHIGGFNELITEIDNTRSFGDGKI